MEIFNYKFMTTESKSFVNYSVVFVLAELNVDAILQYLKTVLNRGPKWSAMDIVRLCINWYYVFRSDQFILERTSVPGDSDGRVGRSDKVHLGYNNDIVISISYYQ